jgi:hypothetical protein
VGCCERGGGVGLAREVGSWMGACWRLFDILAFRRYPETTLIMYEYIDTNEIILSYTDIYKFVG